VVVLKKGIRYPGDKWWSKTTNKPITSSQRSDGNIAHARFMFQSREPRGGATDIFVADFDGERMFNVTEDNVDAYDGFIDGEGNEIAEWVDDKHVRYCSTRKGRRGIVMAINPLYKNQ
jgi:succinate dehydrogenase flavin-adding protein (antitoxin of CptAB toxin-antitoxin module)